MSQSTSPNGTFPAGMSPSSSDVTENGQPVDREALEFRSQFEGRSPLDELVRRGAQHMLGGGFSWLVNDRLQLTWRAAGGLNEPAPDFLTDIRMAWRF